MKLTQKDRLKKYLVSEMLRTHAAFELAAARLYLRGFLALSAKKIDPLILQMLLDQAEEELGHFELLKRIYEAQWGELGESFFQRVDQIKLPPIKTLADFAAASWIFDLAGVLQMKSALACPNRAYKGALKKILREEAIHVLRGNRLRLSRDDAEKKKIHIDLKKWLPAGLICFGSVESQLDILAVKLGLKSKSAAELRSELLRRVSANSRRA